MSEHRRERVCCPACSCAGGELLCDVSYADPAIRSYLDAFYLPQGGADHDVLSSWRYRLRACPGCGLIYQEQIPDDALIQTLYERWIKPEKAFARFEHGRDLAYYLPMVREMVDIIGSFNRRPARELRFLDFAMGWGYWCRMAAAFGCEVYGTELSPARIDFARRFGVRAVSLDEAEAMRFDFINTEQVFEHLAEPFEVLMRLRAMLKPDGMIKISVPDGAGARHSVKLWDWTAPPESPRSLSPVAPLEHINCFDHGALVRMGARAGMRVVTLRQSVVLAPGASRLSPGSLKELLKAIVRPCYRTLVPVRGTHLFLRLDPGTGVAAQGSDPFGHGSSDPAT